MASTSMRPITLEEVRKVREEQKCSLRQAKDIVECRVLMEEAANASTVASLREVVMALIKKASPEYS